MSRIEFHKVYDILGVELEERGESFYNPFLDRVIEDLEKKVRVLALGCGTF
jgi:arginyl-tRNA synthetase